jgi:carbon-monoxide dehydrogenase medium subunit
MIPTIFGYHRAGSLGEAVELLKQSSAADKSAKVLAGGHSLLPMMKLRLARPGTLIDIGRLDELKQIERQGDNLHVGSLVTHHQVATSKTVREHCAVLAEAAGVIGDPQVRNVGTVGGNIAHADPASDLPGVFVALGATVHLLGPDGERQVPAKDFFVGLLTTDLHPDEVLVKVEVPGLEPGTGSAYLKFEHPASGYAVVGAAAVMTLEGSGKCRSAALGFNGVAATPVHATAVTEALVGREPDDDALDDAVSRNLSVADPLGDSFASGEFRVHLAKTYGRRALVAARDRTRR